MIHAAGGGFKMPPAPGAGPSPSEPSATTRAGAPPSSGARIAGSVKPAANAAAYSHKRFSDLMAELPGERYPVLRHDPPGCQCLSPQHGPVGEVAIPFDQRWPRSNTRYDIRVKRPDGIGDGTVVAVYEQQFVLVVLLLAVSGKVYLAHLFKWESSQVR